MTYSFIHEPDDGHEGEHGLVARTLGICAFSDERCTMRTDL